MVHSYISCYVHYIFSTKDREHLITPLFKERLWAYIGGIARDNRMKALAVGGTSNHVHALISLPSTLSIAKGIQLLKGGSSKWVHDEFPAHRFFSWQEGYGAFSIGISRVEETITYIKTQEEHHRLVTFEEEYRAFLRANEIEYDEKYIWD